MVCWIAYRCLVPGDGTPRGPPQWRVLVAHDEAAQLLAGAANDGQKDSESLIMALNLALIKAAVHAEGQALTLWCRDSLHHHRVHTQLVHCDPAANKSELQLRCPLRFLQ